MLVSNAHTFGLYFKTAANIFGFGVRLKIISSNTINLCVSDSALAIEQVAFCSNFDIYAIDSLFNLTIDSTAANTNLGMPRFQLHNTIFAFTTSDDNSAYYTMMTIDYQGDAIDGGTPYKNIMVGSDTSLSSETTQYVRRLVINIR